MCGILWAVCPFRTDSSSLDTCQPLEELRKDLRELNLRRGPDSHAHEVVTVMNGADGARLECEGTVLHLRGSGVTPQPMRHKETQDVLSWNGEVYRGIQVSVLLLSCIIRPPLGSSFFFFLGWIFGERWSRSLGTSEPGD